MTSTRNVAGASGDVEDLDEGFVGADGALVARLVREQREFNVWIAF